MDHAPDPAAWVVTVSMIANLTIFAGYCAIPATALPKLIPWRSPCPSDQRFFRFVRASGVLFFATCGLHHLYAAFIVEHALHVGLVVDEVVQAFAVWCFILGFDAIVKRIARRTPGGLPSPGVSS